MANEEHVEIVRQGAKAIQEWREANPQEPFGLIDADLGGADLSNANLGDANLYKANLANVVLTNANLTAAVLTGAEVSWADLSGANLTWANLTGAQLADANLYKVKLIRAILSEANLTRANLLEARCLSTTFGDVDLSQTKGLDTIRHHGPSTVGIDTLKKSNGKIPAAFLHGCGMSRWEVEMTKLYNPDLTAHEVSEIISANLYSKRTDGPLYLGGVFISYSHSEKGIADKLRERLHVAGASVWLDRHDGLAGDLNKQIQREIRVRDIVVLILSEDSVKSDWVEHELKSTRAKEKEEERDVLCPIAVDDSWKAKMGNPNWGHLSDKLILDFSSWKTKAFDKQFDKLLKGMKINYEVRK